MSKQVRKISAEPDAATTPTVAPAPAAPSAAAPPANAAPAAEAATGPTQAKPTPTPKALVSRILDAARARLAGTRLERVAQRARDAAAGLPGRAERELDSLLDKVGLIRKSRTGQAAPAPEVGTAPPKAA